MSVQSDEPRSFSVSTALSSTSLARLASHTQPQLDELKLSHILNGETCPPISFPDFAAFISNKEFSTENLLFILWFRSYRARFEQLEQKVKVTIPIPSTRLGDRYDPFGYLDKASSHSEDGSKGDPEGPVLFNEPFTSHSSAQKPTTRHAEMSHPFKPCHECSEEQKSTPHHCQSCERPRRKSRLFSITHSILNSRRTSASSHNQDSKAVRSILHPTMHPPLPPPGTEYAEPAAQPMREEAQRAFATFLRKGGSRELGISDEMRQFTKICLARSTAPEVFSPLYEEIYHVVETQSLPHFLQHAKSNINRPKQLFWYLVGFGDFLFGVIVYLILTLLLPSRPFGVRAYRLFSVIFVTFGIMQAYSAYRGFCSQVWGRSHRQLRPWEMDELDDEETVTECDGEMEMKEERRSGSMNIPDGASQTGFDQSIRSPVVEISLPSEVRPLADLGGVVRVPSDGYEMQNASPVPSKTDSMVLALPVLDERDMSDVERRQFEIRRTTIKAPAASEAFPIPDHAVPFVPPPRLSFSNAEARSRREISPFVSDDIEPLPRLGGSSKRNSANLALSGAPLARTKSSLPSIAAQKTSKELSALLLRLRRATPSSADAEDNMDPLESSNSNGASKGRRRGNSIPGVHGYGHGHEEKKAKVFGPEKLVEDPRIKAVYGEIKRDILIVGSIVASIWITLCLAVPCRGLAS